MKITIEHLTKIFPARNKKGTEVVAVDDMNIEIPSGKLVGLLGPSGCGKSTTLFMLSGLEAPSRGRILFDNQDVTTLQAERRGIGLVFQNYALYPHLSVFENMAFSLRLRKVPQEEVYRRVTEAAEILGITEYLTRKPRALSGGQRQRVAIGRAMVRDSKVFLMDEPLSNLDAKLRNQMRAEIILLRKKIDTTFVYVTHDQTEAMTLGDRIVIMKDGFIMQVGTPVEVFDMPDNLFVAEFIGAPKMNTMRAQLVEEEDKYFVVAHGVKMEVDGEKGVALSDRAVGSREVILGVRPEHITMTTPDDPEGIHCTVQVNEMMGSELHLHVVTDDGEKLIVRVPTITLSNEERFALRFGAEIYVTFEGKVMHFFDVDTEKNLLTAADLETPAEEVPAEEVPAEETPVEEIPVEETPAEEVPNQD